MKPEDVCRRILGVLALVCAGAFAVFDAYARTGESVGVVLSGGGAKGIAHIGVIKALEDNDIPVDYISGTSMGAIVGGLYACGYTPEEMMQFITSPYFTYLSTGRIAPAYTYYFSSEPPTPQIFALPIDKGVRDKKVQQFNPQSLISPMPMSFGLMEIFAPHSGACGGDFDRLFVPFRCVASSMTHRREQVFGSGYLPDAIRASMSFPLVFQAVEIDGDIYYDGGIYDNFPVDVMKRDFAPGVMIGVDVSSESSGPPNSYIDQLDLLVTNPQSYFLSEEDGVKVRVDLSDFGLLDFNKAEEIYRRGYDKAMEMMDSIKARVVRRMPASTLSLKRSIYKSSVPALVFDKVKVEGGSASQNEYVKYLFEPKHGDSIGVESARLSFYRAVASEKFSYLKPRAVDYNDSLYTFTLQLETNVKSKFELGAGAFITSSNNSYLYLRAGYSSLSFSSVNADFEAWIGQSYMAGTLKGSLNLHGRSLSALRFEAVAWRNRYYENEKLFFRDNEPSFVIEHEYFCKLGLAMAAGRRMTVNFGLGGGRIYNTFFQNDNPESYIAGRDNVGLNLGQAFMGLDASTIDDINYPTTGYSRHGNVAVVGGKARLYSAMLPTAQRNSDKTVYWGQVSWRERDYFDMGHKWALGIEGQAILSTRKLLKDYYASVSLAPSFSPTPAMSNIFDPKLRANSFFAVGIVPVYKFNSSLSGRLNLNAFVPVRSIVELPIGVARYGSWFDTAHFLGELDMVLSLPFGNICAYANYSTTRDKFNCGISLGLYLGAPTFLN